MGSKIRRLLIADALRGTGKRYCVSGFPDGSTNPKPTITYGDPEFAAEWDFYLFDTTKNTAGQPTVPVGKLKKNNLFRFVDGSFAPTVGITEAMRAECDVELYLDSAGTQKYCDPGTFDPVTFYNTHGMASLYDSAGTSVRVLRPWETTETKYTIGLGRADTVYLLDGVKGNSGLFWKGLFSSACIWDGIDISRYPLPPTAISPCPITTVGGKARNFFYLYEGENRCKSANGAGNLCTMFSNGRTYPRTVDISQTSLPNYTRGINSDPKATIPYAEGGYHALNTYITSMELEVGTKTLNSIFGSGISGNYACTNEDTLRTYGGVKYRISGETTWKYARWYTTDSNICYNTTGTATYFSNMINSIYPKEQCMESQMVASWITERGLLENTEFEFFGGTYWYTKIPGVVGLEEGDMNVKIFKKMSQTFSAYNPAGETVSYDTEVVLSMVLLGGANLTGDIFCYWGGGYEMVGTNTLGAEGNGTSGFDVAVYLEPDQSKWHSETVYYKNDLGVFDFESTYPKVADFVTLGDSYALSREPYTALRTKKGGNLTSQGEGFYMWDNRYWSTTPNQRVRIGSRFRGYAYTTACSLRSVFSYYASAITSQYYAGSAQIRMDVSSLQAE